MTAADRREELEAAIRAAITKNGRCTATGRCTGCESNISDALALADTYATATADERISGRVTGRTTGRKRLAEATAEKFRGTS